MSRGEKGKNNMLKKEERILCLFLSGTGRYAWSSTSFRILLLFVSFSSSCRLREMTPWDPFATPSQYGKPGNIKKIYNCKRLEKVDAMWHPFILILFIYLHFFIVVPTQWSPFSHRCFSTCELSWECRSCSAERLVRKSRIYSHPEGYICTQ